MIREAIPVLVYDLPQILAGIRTFYWLSLVGQLVLAVYVVFFYGLRQSEALATSPGRDVERLDEAARRKRDRAA
jgi:hypothetical protein